MSQEELAAVKTEMERKVDQLHSQLHYWQNVTVNILNEHCSSIKTGIYSFFYAPKDWYTQCAVNGTSMLASQHLIKGPGSSMETGDTVLTSTVFNITQNSKHISA